MIESITVLPFCVKRNPVARRFVLESKCAPHVLAKSRRSKTVSYSMESSFPARARCVVDAGV